MKDSPPEGLLLVDKPAGPTSHDVVDRVRRLLRQKVGHAGTLDPAVSGLLPLVLGRATRMVRFLPHSPKIYEGVLRLGLTTSTDDLAGEVLRRHDGPLPAPGEVLAAAEALVGKTLQVAPAVSAKKVRGRRLYQVARQGCAVVAPASPVEVFRFELEATCLPEEWAFVAEVSAGTYVRSLARDLGARLGCGGTLARLRRTAIGPMRVEGAISWTEHEKEMADRLRCGTIPLEAMPFEPCSVRLDDDRARSRFVAGLPVALAEGVSPGPCVVFDQRGTLLGAATVDGDLHLRPKVVLEQAPGALPAVRARRTAS